MLRDNLETEQDVCEAFDDLASDINYLYSVVSDMVDDLEVGEESEEHDKLREIYETLESLTAYV